MLTVDSENCRLQILDNGHGVDQGGSGLEANGLVNMRRRAEKLYGTFEIETPDAGGTLMIWQVPISR